MKVCYQIRIVLKNVRPPIWRRLLVPGEITLADLHTVIQTAMGWQDYHLHEFSLKPGKLRVKAEDFRGAQTDPRLHSRLMGMMRIDRVFLPAEAMDAGVIDEAEDEAGVTLMELCPREKGKLTYSYDFGDNWIHEVIVQKIMPAKPGVLYPVCTAGKRACPPEDCGGPWGYDRLLGILDEPEDEEHEDMLNWVGESFDPEDFDMERVNEVFRMGS